ncbi:hypothetical protein THAOC_33793, partial [Thalassiosira oceanica]
KKVHLFRTSWLVTPATGYDDARRMSWRPVPAPDHFSRQSSSALRTVLFSAVGFCTVQKSTTPMQNATRHGVAYVGSRRVVRERLWTTASGIYPAAVAVESLYLFDMFLYTPAADGAAIS